MNIKTDWSALRKKRQEEELSDMARALQESYESPIMMCAGQMEMEKIDDYTWRMVQKTGVRVSKEELIKALQYDRDQFQTGFLKGWLASQLRFVEAREVIICKDCVHFAHDINGIGRCTRDGIDMDCGYDCYCSFAERRDDD